MIRFSSIGDIVLTTPILRALKLQLGAEVHTLGKGKFRQVLADNPYIDQRYELADSLSETVKQLRSEHYDQVIDLHNNLRSRLIGIRLGVPITCVNKLNWQKWILVNLKVDKMPDLHIVDRYRAACGDLGVDNDGKGLDYFLPPNAQEVYQTLQSKHQLSSNYQCIAIGAAHFTKRIPIDKIVEICNQTQGQIILLGGPDDATVGGQIKENANNKEIVNLAGKVSLTESAIVLSHASLLVTPDTGLMHIGAALDIPMVTVWGNTVPKLGMYPYLDNSRYHIVEQADLSCRPCSKIGYQQCPKGHFKCMTDIESQSIVEKMQSFIE